MQAVDEDIDLKQMRDMAAAKKRWDGLVFKLIFFSQFLQLYLKLERLGSFWFMIKQIYCLHS